jgi:addiction module HigA family antidote
MGKSTQRSSNQRERRICFVWQEDDESQGVAAGARRMEIVDYHREESMMNTDSLNEETMNADQELIPLETPGEILRAEFLEPMGLGAYALAKAVGVPQIRISEILHGKQAVTAETSVLLDRYFGLSDGFWFRLQADYDLRRTRHKMTERLGRVQPYAQAGLAAGS